MSSWTWKNYKPPPYARCESARHETWFSFFCFATKFLIPIHFPHISSHFSLFSSYFPHIVFLKYGRTSSEFFQIHFLTVGHFPEKFSRSDPRENFPRREGGGSGISDWPLRQNILGWGSLKTWDVSTSLRRNIWGYLKRKENLLLLAF